ncbi:hypothetical protein WA158_005498 [Blastocystis sp. Blastoise]
MLGGKVITFQKKTSPTLSIFGTSGNTKKPEKQEKQLTVSQITTEDNQCSCCHGLQSPSISSDEIDGEPMQSQDNSETKVIQDQMVTSVMKENQDEEDPLDAFMQEIDKEVQQYSIEDKTEERLDIQNDNEELDALDRDEDNKLLHQTKETVQYDENGNPIEPEEKNINYNIHYIYILDINNSIHYIYYIYTKYHPFRRNFYIPSPEVLSRDSSIVQKWMQEKYISLESDKQILPIMTFEELNLSLPPPILEAIHKQGLVIPTPVQSQCLPYALSGYNLIGISQTGSGKTYTYLWPLITHIIDQPPLAPKDGPIAIVLVPTRELADQVYVEAKKYTKSYELKLVSLVGGASKWEQKKSLYNRQAEICIATPGRLIDHIKEKNIRLNRVTFLVLDEADRMLSLGFEGQLRSITNQIRKDRQTLFFSATFPNRVEHFANDMLLAGERAKIRVGKVGASGQDIEQKVIMLDNYGLKWRWLESKIKRFDSLGKVLIFVSTRAETEELSDKVSVILGTKVESLHGDKMQSDREHIMRLFRKPFTEGGLNILISTDVAARGIDVQGIQTVINYDVAKNIDIHIHRIGRTGRMGLEGVKPGTAYTLVTSNDKSFAVQLVRHLISSNQPVPDPLLKLAKEGGYTGSTPSNTFKKTTLSNGREGLGFGANDRRAVTSEQLSDNFHINSSVAQIKEVQLLKQQLQMKMNEIESPFINTSIVSTYSRENPTPATSVDGFIHSNVDRINDNIIPITTTTTTPSELSKTLDWDPAKMAERSAQIAASLKQQQGTTPSLSSSYSISNKSLESKTSYNRDYSSSKDSGHSSSSYSHSSHNYHRHHHSSRDHYTHSRSRSNSKSRSRSRNSSRSRTYRNERSPSEGRRRRYRE